MSSQVSSHPSDTILTPAQAADFLGVSLPILEALTSRNVIPSSVHGRHRRYLRSQLAAWQQAVA